jgi:hypothetical protein
MRFSDQAPTRIYRTPARRLRTFLRRLVVLMAFATVAAVALNHPFASSSSQDGSGSGAAARGHGEPNELAHPGVGIPRVGDGRLGEADGAVPDGTTVFDDGVPAVTNLDPDLLEALQAAAADAGRDGITFLVNSGWRSSAYQQHLLSDAVTEYGSAAEAARWVATPETSSHVSGEAADIGPDNAESWLSEHGSGYGLCQIYANEPWHYELRSDAETNGCPQMYADPTQDPRMR